MNRPWYRTLSAIAFGAAFVFIMATVGLLVASIVETVADASVDCTALAIEQCGGCHCYWGGQQCESSSDNCDTDTVIVLWMATVASAILVCTACVCGLSYLIAEAAKIYPVESV